MTAQEVYNITISVNDRKSREALLRGRYDVYFCKPEDVDKIYDGVTEFESRPILKFNDDDQFVTQWTSSTTTSPSSTYALSWSRHFSERDDVIENLDKTPVESGKAYKLERDDDTITLQAIEGETPWVRPGFIGLENHFPIHPIFYKNNVVSWVSPTLWVPGKGILKVPSARDTVCMWFASKSSPPTTDDDIDTTDFSNVTTLTLTRGKDLEIEYSMHGTLDGWGQQATTERTLRPENPDIPEKRDEVTKSNELQKSQTNGVTKAAK